MEPSRDDLLLATLESLRPASAPAFAAELDERAAAGFPRPPRAAASPVARVAAWARGLSPRRMILTGGATALAAIAIATVVVAASDTGGSSLNTDVTSSSSMQDSSARGAAAGESRPATAAPETSASSAGAAGGGVAGSRSNDYIQAQQSLPEVEVVSGSSAGRNIDGSGPYASGAAHRDVERAAEMVLGAEPGEVGEATGKVFEAVHQVDGIVLSSSVRGGPEGDAGADFELLIPSAKLSDALAAFSGIAEVRSRHEASNDITAPTNTVGEGLQDSHARIDGLLNELADSETETEREAVEAQLRSERRHAAALKSQLSNLQRRANLSHVSLRIETGASSSPSSGGGWDVGDAFHDAGHILSIAAGAAIVGLAIVGPIALIALLVWLASRAWVRQRRERALG
jgi:Domain of unknown function (DUF4349)